MVPMLVRVRRSKDRGVGPGERDRQNRAIVQHALQVAGLAGRLTTMGQLPAALPVWALAATAGGLLGASLGSRRLAPVRFRQLLALVLVIAGAKLLFA